MYPKRIIKIQSEKMPASKRFATFHKDDGIHPYLWMGFLIFKVIMTYCQAKFAIDHIHDFSLFSGAAATFFIPLLGMTKLYSRLIYKKKIREMFKIIDNDFWDTSIANKQLSDTLSSRISFISTISSNHMYICLGMCTFFACFPLAKYPDGTKQLPSVAWFPFDTNPSPIYEITYLTLALSHHFSILCNANYDHIYIYFSQNLSVQFCLLKELCRNITDVPSILDEEKYDSLEYQTIIFKRLQTCVTHHIRLAKFLGDMNKIFSLCLGIQIILSILSLVFIGYILTTEDNEVITNIKLLLYVSVLSIQIVLYAMHGSELEYQYETVAQAIYDSQWYFGNSSFRKGVRFMLMTSQKPVYITAMGLTKINNPCIIMIYKMVFSVLTLLQKMVG